MQVVTPHCEIGSHILFINIMNKCVEVKLMSHTETLLSAFDFFFFLREGKVFRPQPIL